MIKLFTATCPGIAMLMGFYPKENNNNDSNVTVVAATCYGYTPYDACSI
jgi:hypothetical protein